jgi:hypothetical protein
MSSHSGSYYRRCERGCNHGKHGKPGCIRAQPYISYQPQPNNTMRNHQNNPPYVRDNSRAEPLVTIGPEEALRLFLSGIFVFRIGEVLRRR